MGVLEIKATLLRSNPQVIRQFRAKDELTFRVCHEILQVLIGWTGSCDYEYCCGDTAVREAAPLQRKKKETAQRLCTPDTKLREVMTGTEEEWLYRFGSGRSWSMRLEVKLQEQEKEEELPCAVRGRGANPPQECTDIAFFNHLQRAWNENSYYFRAAYTFKQSSYVFSASNANMELSMRFGKGREAMQQSSAAGLVPDWSLCRPVSELLEGRTVQELKNLAGRLSLILESGLRKKQIIERIAESIRSVETAQRCLQEMNLEEYRTFRRLCQKGGVYRAQEERKYRTLISFGFLMTGLDNQIICSKELVQSYVLLLNSGFEAPYLKRQYAKACIMVGCELYAAIDRGVFDRLMQACYPDEVTETERDGLWQELSGGNIDGDIQFLRSGIFYHIDYIKPEIAKEWVSRSDKLPRYIPDRGTLEQIAASGLLFAKEAGKQIESWLSRSCGIRAEWAGDYHRELYRVLHVGGTTRQAAEWLFQSSYRRSNPAQIKRISDYLEQMKPMVRQVGLLGYTEEEYGRLRANEEKKIKIMPNAPCPCGSGRKYKHCCGRK